MCGQPFHYFAQGWYCVKWPTISQDTSFSSYEHRCAANSPSSWGPRSLQNKDNRKTKPHLNILCSHISSAGSSDAPRWFTNLSLRWYWCKCSLRSGILAISFPHFPFAAAQSLQGNGTNYLLYLLKVLTAICCTSCTSLHFHHCH